MMLTMVRHKKSLAIVNSWALSLFPEQFEKVERLIKGDGFCAVTFIATPSREYDVSSSVSAVRIGSVFKTGYDYIA